MSYDDLPTGLAKGARRTRMRNGNRFKLGLFGMNCSGSVATTAPERWNAGWLENRDAARLADAAGIERFVASGHHGLLHVVEVNLDRAVAFKYDLESDLPLPSVASDPLVLDDGPLRFVQVVNVPCSLGIKIGMKRGNLVGRHIRAGQYIVVVLIGPFPKGNKAV